MLLTNRTGVKNTRDLLRAFGGLNETYGCTEAEYSGGMNFSARDFPALSTRLPRRRLQELAGLNGMYHLNGLLTVCGRDLVYTPDEAPAQPVTVKNAVADSRKTMVGIGTKILIFPDKVAFDTADGSAAPLGAAWEAGSLSVSFAPCDASGDLHKRRASEPGHDSGDARPQRDGRQNIVFPRVRSDSGQPAQRNGKNFHEQQPERKGREGNPGNGKRHPRVILPFVALCG